MSHVGGRTWPKPEMAFFAIDFVPVCTQPRVLRMVNLYTLAWQSLEVQTQNKMGPSTIPNYCRIPASEGGTDMGEWMRS